MNLLRRYAAAIAICCTAIWAKILGVHMCQDEVLAVLACVPFARPLQNWLVYTAKRWRNRHEKPACCHGDASFHHRNQ